MNKFAGLLALTAVVTAQQVIDTITEHRVLYPGDNCCTLYDFNNFRHGLKSFCLEDGEAEADFKLSIYGFANKLESFYCGKSVQYDFSWYHAKDYSYNGYGEMGAGTL